MIEQTGGPDGELERSSTRCPDDLDRNTMSDGSPVDRAALERLAAHVIKAPSDRPFPGFPRAHHPRCYQATHTAEQLESIGLWADLCDCRVWNLLDPDPAAAVPEAEDGRGVPNAAVEAAHATWTTSNAFGKAMWRECLEAAAPFILAAVPAREDERERALRDALDAVRDCDVVPTAPSSEYVQGRVDGYTRATRAIQFLLAAAPLPEGQEG